MRERFSGIKKLSKVGSFIILRSPEGLTGLNKISPVNSLASEKKRTLSFLRCLSFRACEKHLNDNDNDNDNDNNNKNGISLTCLCLVGKQLLFSSKNYANSERVTCNCIVTLPCFLTSAIPVVVLLWFKSALCELLFYVKVLTKSKLRDCLTVYFTGFFSCFNWSQLPSSILFRVLPLNLFLNK